MRLGLHALGIGPGAGREVIDAVASAAEAEGFATLWAGEHVVMVDRSDSRYPYSADGRISVPADADWLDPLVLLSFAAAATRTIRIATGVLLLPEHNPVLLAKQTARPTRARALRTNVRCCVIKISCQWFRQPSRMAGPPVEVSIRANGNTCWISRRCAAPEAASCTL